jgi:ABC-type transporter Mla maintaining outer membrane lipid asymmetry permease subunit MlaE
MSQFAERVPEGTKWDSTLNKPVAIDPNYFWNEATGKLELATTLGNGLTKAQKMTWVIGLTLAAWGLIYWSQKQPNK